MTIAYNGTGEARLYLYRLLKAGGLEDTGRRLKEALVVSGNNDKQKDGRGC